VIILFNLFSFFPSLPNGLSLFFFLSNPVFVSLIFRIFLGFHYFECFLLFLSFYLRFHLLLFS
jgi:hypothetical protein